MIKWIEFETWKEFLAEWSWNTTEAGAVGLLYAGARLKSSGERTDTEFGHEDHARCFTRKVSFFLDVTAPHNSIIEATARRLVMNQLLGESLGLSWSGLIGPAHTRLVDFLGEVHFDVRKPPFPKKAEEFLFQAFSKWNKLKRDEQARKRKTRNIDEPDDQVRKFAFGGDYDATVPLVKACVAWGVLPNVLVGQRFSCEMLQEIRAAAEPFLLASLGEDEDQRTARYRGSLTWSMDSKPPRDLYIEEGQTELWKRNGITLHYLRSI